eukprot:8748200-Pyramimonas_sp.AAC.1
MSEVSGSCPQWTPSMGPTVTSQADVSSISLNIGSNREKSGGSTLACPARGGCQSGARAIQRRRTARLWRSQSVSCDSAGPWGSSSLSRTRLRAVSGGGPRWSESCSALPGR